MKPFVFRLAPVILLLLGLCLGTPLQAGEKYEYLTQREFLAAAFADVRPSSGKLLIEPELGDRLASVFGHRYKEIRIRWWRSGNRSAWLIDEVGKFKPITIGVVVDNARLHSIAVLVYREGHGMEVAEPAFTGLFPGAALGIRDGKPDHLDRDIDNITGSTLSVRAMTRTARAALVLDEWLRQQENP